MRGNEPSLILSFSKPFRNEENCPFVSFTPGFIEEKSNLYADRGQPNYATEFTTS